MVAGSTQCLGLGQGRSGDMGHTARAGRDSSMGKGKGKGVFWPQVRVVVVVPPQQVPPPPLQGVVGVEEGQPCL